MTEEEDCKCIRISGHLEAVRWLLWPRPYKPGAGYLSLGDWTRDPHIWLHYVESTDGLLADDDVLLSTDTRYWSIHDVQRYFFGDLHCEKVLFTYQYPNLSMPSRLGSYFWKENIALKRPPALYQKEFHRSLEVTLKKLEATQAQMSRLMISDQLIKLERLDHFKRKSFFRILMNIMSFQDRLELVSLENLCCKRLEGVRLIQQLACFNAHTLKYLFLWRFVLPNENPLLINYSYLTGMTTTRSLSTNSQMPSQDQAFFMSTDEEKSRIAKLLQGLEIPEVKLSERCSELIKDFHQKFDKEVEEEALSIQMDELVLENPYRVDRQLLEENERKLRELLAECKRAKRECTEDATKDVSDPKRPWRTNTNKEKLVRINSELKQHLDKATQLITPLVDQEMQDLVSKCQAETSFAPPVSGDRLRDTVDAAKKNLINFQYRKLENTTATAILPEAHEIAHKKDAQEITLRHCNHGQYIPRPESRHCFLRSLGVMQNLRVLALEFSHIADGTGSALISLLPVIKRPHFRLQLICREEQTPGRADAALGVGGYDIPDTAWRRVNIACPDLYLHMAFFRIRDYDHIRRFLVPSIPLRETHLQLGIDLKMKQRQDSDLSCFIRHIAYRYADTLVSLSIHQWRFAVFPLRRVFELMPRLVRFHYIGRVEDDVDLKRMFLIFSCGVCDKLKQVNIQIQDEEIRRHYWRKVVDSLTNEYTDIMRLYNVKFCLTIYKN